jgi:antitoxin (DNA-binding transcriptional repressor) of toxin-antitoxin stability system
MMNQISKSQFKAKALEFFRAVEASGEPLIITEYGQPKLEIRPYHPPAVDPFAKLRGTVLFYHDPLAPVGEEDWDAL